MSVAVKRRRRAASGAATPAPNLFPTSMPVGDLAVDSSLGGGMWRQIFANDFDYDVPIGGLVPTSNSQSLAAGSYAKVNTDIDDWSTWYANNTNSSWGEKYSDLKPDEAGYIQPGQPGYPAKYFSHAKWYPSKTVEFADSCFKVHFHSEDLNGDGTMYGLGAAMCLRNPANPTTSKIGPYLRYQYRMRHTGHTGLAPGQTSYWTSVPLAIDSTNWPYNGEFDWTEMDANKVVQGHYHPSKAPLDEPLLIPSGESAKEWLTATVEWVPGKVKFWANDVLRFSTTDRVSTGPHQIVMQHEQNWRAGVGTAIMEMDWLSVWQYEPPA